MAAHMRLNNEFTKDQKCHNLMRWLKYGQAKVFAYEAKVYHKQVLFITGCLS